MTLLEQLAKELSASSVLSAPPKDSVCADMLAIKLGCSGQHASFLLRNEVKAGRLKVVRVKQAESRQPLNYYVSVK